MGELGALGIMVGFVLGIAVAVSWIVLPFAILGTKPLLRQILAEQRLTRETIERRIPYQPKT